MTAKLPDGDYPFIEQRLPLTELAMIETPTQLEELLRSEAAANGIEIIRDEPVETALAQKSTPTTPRSSCLAERKRAPSHARAQEVSKGRG